MTWNEKLVFALGEAAEKQGKEKQNPALALLGLACKQIATDPERWYALKRPWRQA